MKNLLLMLLFSAFIFKVSAQKRETFSITGNITNLEDGTLFYLIKAKWDGSADTVKRAKSMSGKVQFVGSLVLEGEMHFVKMDTSLVKLPTGKNSWILILLDHSSINLQGDIKEWPDVKILGSAATDEYNSFLQSAKQPFQDYNTNMKAVRGDTVLRNRYTGELKKFFSDYIGTNPDSYVSACQLLKSSWFEREEIAALYNKFTKRVQNSFYGIKLKEVIDRPLILEKRAKENEIFLKTNEKRTGVVRLPSGVQYEVLKKGVGKLPVISDKVKVNYTGTLLNGEKFDSSVDKGRPIELSLSNVIKGWRQAIVLMPVGSKWRVYVPADQGYGDQVRPNIPPRSILVFDMELLEIVK